MEIIKEKLFELKPGIRYFAINRLGKVVAMEQNPDHPSFNPHDTDNLEEMFVNPVAVYLIKKRGALDLGGMRYIIIRYGTQYQVLFPLDDGHLSVGVELSANVEDTAEAILGFIK